MRKIIQFRLILFLHRARVFVVSIMSITEDTRWLINLRDEFAHLKHLEKNFKHNTPKRIHPCMDYSKAWMICSETIFIEVHVCEENWSKSVTTLLKTIQKWFSLILTTEHSKKTTTSPLWINHRSHPTSTPMKMSWFSWK